MDRELRATISKEDDRHSYDVINALSNLYSTKVVHLEKLFAFNEFYEPILGGECAESEFMMKPTIFLIGAYSTGKTTFIRNLLGCSYPDMNISPEPSTDKFNILIHGEDELVVAGAVAVGLPHLPFNGLSSFGIDFVNKMVATTVKSSILSKININLKQ